MPNRNLEVEISRCIKCGESRHYVIAKKTIHGCNEQFGLDTEWAMVECCGCEQISLRQFLWLSGEVISASYYPPPIFRNQPNWLEDLSPVVQPLLREIYLALQAGTFRLAMMGTRAILDLFIVDKTGDAGTFSEKLNDLERKGFVGRQDRQVLEVALEAGHASSHRGYRPDVDQINQVIDIVENLLQRDLLASSSSSLKKAIPPRLKLVKPGKGENT
jgi:hypothetical protein